MNAVDDIYNGFYKGKSLGDVGAGESKSYGGIQSKGFTHETREELHINTLLYRPTPQGLGRLGSSKRLTHSWPP